MSSTDTYDVIVVGVGSMGAATCKALADRGVRVLGLEQFDIPHDRGAHHGFSRIVRLCYHEHPDYVPLLSRSIDLWEQWNVELQEQVYHPVGLIHMGTPECPIIQGVKLAATKYGLPHEELGLNALRARYPQFRTPDDFVGFFEPRAGFARSNLTVAACATAAMKAGAELHAHEPVLSWSAAASPIGGVTVRTTRGEYAAGKLVIAGGAWSSRLLGELNVPLTVTRQVLGWVWPKSPAMYALGRLGGWNIASRTDSSSYYGFPMMNDNPGFKLARHHVAEACDPDTVNRQPTAADEEELRTGLREFIPDADGPILGIRVCLYTNTPDGHFVIDRHPEYEQVTLACGFSGHGFKFVPVVGEVLADLAERGSTKHAIEFLGLSRFGKSSTLSPG